jgi:hypothetical protein
MNLLPSEVIVLFAFLFGVATIGAAILGISWFAKRTPPAETSSDGPAGVGGWLLLLVVSLMFLGPLMGIGQINADFRSAESINPNLEALDAWSTFKFASWSTFLVVSCLSFYAGFGLAKGRDISVVNRAKVLLWVIGPVASLVIGSVIPRIVFGKVEWDPGFFKSFLFSVVAAAIWTAYLSKSKRVRATYAKCVSNLTSEGAVIGVPPQP